MLLLLVIRRQQYMWRGGSPMQWYNKCTGTGIVVPFLQWTSVRTYMQLHAIENTRRGCRSTWAGSPCRLTRCEIKNGCSKNDAHVTNRHRGARRFLKSSKNGRLSIILDACGQTSVVSRARIHRAHQIENVNNSN